MIPRNEKARNDRRGGAVAATRVFDPRALVVLGAVLLLVVGQPLRAAADTSQSTANAANATLAGGSLVTSGTESAANDGMSPTDDRYAQPLLSVMGLGTLLQNGTLSQRAIAFNDGNSAACAGVTGNNGSVTIQPDGTCVVAAGSTQGVTISLGGLLTLRADAITASCFGKSDGTVTASAGLVNARVLLAGIQQTTLGANPAPNTTLLNLLGLGLVNVSQNVQSSTGPGHVKATALQVRLIGSTVGLDVGTVSCGANVVTAPTPAIPAPVIPIALAAAVAAVVSPPGRRLLAQAKASVAR